MLIGLLAEILTRLDEGLPMKRLLTGYIVLSFLLVSNFAHATNDLQYFKDTYADADADFMRIFKKIQRPNPHAEIHEFEYAGGTIKSFFIPAKKKQKNLLILISGTHGIEAHAGSAVQRWFLENNPVQNNTAYLFVHGFNLYGFKNYRRVNENNIDLNRNFVMNRNITEADDADYKKLNTFLNPEDKPSLHILSKSFFIANSVIKIIFNSLESLRRSILKGQYSFPKGLYYGGTQHEPQSILINDLVLTYAKPYKKIFLIDLHTGYGEKGKLHLLAGKQDDLNSQKLLKVFAKEDINFSDQQNYYAVQGEMLQYFINQLRINVDAEISGVTFEYGTMNSQKTLGSIESLRRMVLENQNFHYPSDDKATSEQIKKLFKEMFYPSDETWRTAILKQTNSKINNVLNYLSTE